MKLYVNNQKIEIRDDTFYVSGSEGLYEIEFEFSPDWEGYIKTVVFKKLGMREEYSLSTDTIEIPEEFLASPGRVSVGAIGEKGDKKKPTEWSCVLEIKKGVI